MAFRMKRGHLFISCFLASLIASTVTAVPRNCDFEDGSPCWNVPGLSQAYKWHVSTNAPTAQPLNDHTSGMGRYLYANGAPPAKHNDRARLLSGNLEPVPSCLTFWYHMSGANIGVLRVLVRNVIGGQEQELWKRTGNQGDAWQKAMVPVESFGLFEVVIEASRGTAYEGSNIALDDIQYRTEKCATSKLLQECGLGLKGLGCFKDDYHDRVFSQLLLTYRGQAASSLMVWSRFGASLSRLLCNCAKLAKEQGYKYFGLQFYGECWSSPGNVAYNRKGTAKSCINGTFALGNCEGANDGACVGAALVNAVYELE